MDKITTTNYAFAKALEEVVAEAGAEFVYQRGNGSSYSKPNCVYVRDSQPSCIIGQTAHKLGAPLELLSRYDHSGGVPANIMLPEIFEGLDTDTIWAAKVAQEWQDSGRPWGEALEQFQNYKD